MCGMPYSVYRMVTSYLWCGVAACTTGARPATRARAASRAVRRFMVDVFRRRCPGSCLVPAGVEAAVELGQRVREAPRGDRVDELSRLGGGRTGGGPATVGLQLHLERLRRRRTAVEELDRADPVLPRPVVGG